MTYVWAERLICWLLAAFYAYGAAVHLANMASLTGFDWSAAPLKWQVLDVVYLGVDGAAVVLLLLRPVFGFGVVAIAAISQIVLYTVGRAWILDVPEAFVPSPESVTYLDFLVVFHVICLVAISGLVLMRPQP